MNRSDIKADTEELVRISLWCSENLSHDRMKVGVAMQFYMGDFEGDPLAGALSDAAKWRHLQAIDEARTSRPPGGIGVDVFKALTCDLPKKDKRILKVIWPKFEGIRWNRGTLKSAVSALGTKLARGQNSRGAKPDDLRDEALAMIRRTATTDRLQLPERVETEGAVTAPVTAPLSQPPAPLSQTILDLPQGPGRPPSSSPSSSPPVGRREEKTPPTPHGGEKGGVAKSRNPRRRKIPDITIPSELLAIGIDQPAFEQRVLGRERTKPLPAWQAELDNLVPMVEECGSTWVLEAFKDATSGGWSSCLPKHCRASAAGNGSRPGGQRQSGRKWEPVPEEPFPDVKPGECLTCGAGYDVPGLVMPGNCIKCDLAHFGPHKDPGDRSPLYAGYTYDLGIDGRPVEWSAP